MRRRVLLSLVLSILAVSSCRYDEPATPAIRASASGITSVTNHYVATWGSATNPGTFSLPWTLEYALQGAGGHIQAGDTVWVRGSATHGDATGVYQGDPATPHRYVVSVSTGAPGAPVVFKTYQQEFVTIEDDRSGITSPSQFNVQQPYLVFWGFEFTNKNLGSSRTALRPDMVYNNVGAHDNTYINLTVHDGGVGFYNEAAAYNVMITGCIFYNIGYQPAGDRGHGHAIYIRSNTGPVYANTNVMLNQFGYGIHAYSDALGGGGLLNRIVLSWNIAFNNGSNATNSLGGNILLGGPDETATNDTLFSNVTYDSPGSVERNVEVGYRATTLRNGTVRLAQNTFVGGRNVLEIGYWQSNGVTMDWDNTVGAHSASDTVLNLRDPSTTQYIWSSNTYFRDPSDQSWGHAGSLFNFNDWKISTGLGSTDAAFPGLPTTWEPWLVSNPFNQSQSTNRLFVWVYNSDHKSSVSFDPSDYFPVGAHYTIRNVQDPYAPTTVHVEDGSPVVIQITSVTPVPPVGLSASRSPNTGIEWQVYVLDFWP